jgi:ribosomal protein S18 acetylase RimI-like enzyme
LFIALLALARFQGQKQEALCESLMSDSTIDQIREDEWEQVAALIAEAVPNALISRLGNKFGATFYSRIVEQDGSCGYVVRDESGNILGVAIGAIDYRKAPSIAFRGQLWKLLIAANLRILRWSVISWMISGILGKLGGHRADYKDRPVAELVAIVIHSKARAIGLAQRLVEEMEAFMISKGLNGPYTILTEKANARANRFYQKIGAAFVRTNLHHGREINEWHKEITKAK